MEQALVHKRLEKTHTQLKQVDKTMKLECSYLAEERFHILFLPIRCGRANISRSCGVLLSAKRTCGQILEEHHQLLKLHGFELSRKVLEQGSTHVHVKRLESKLVWLHKDTMTTTHWSFFMQAGTSAR